MNFEPLHDCSQHYKSNLVTDDPCRDKNQGGHSFLKSILMAVEHFNTRNDTLIPEMAALTEGCSLQFDTLSILGTSGADHEASGALASRYPPCAVVGGFTDTDALELSAMASAQGFPNVTHRSFTYCTQGPWLSPYTNVIYPTFADILDASLQVLAAKGRDNYFTLLYPISDTDLQWREAMELIASIMGVFVRSVGYDDGVGRGLSTDGLKDMRATFREVKEGGYRTVLAVVKDPLRELSYMAPAAVAEGLLEGDFVFAWIGGVATNIISFNDHEIQKLLVGPIAVSPLEKIWFDEDTFREIWREQPLAGTSVDVLDTPPFDSKLNQCRLPAFASGYIYDAVMLTGSGLRGALGDGSTPSVASVTASSRNVPFTGMSGNVSFDCYDCGYASCVWLSLGCSLLAILSQGAVCEVMESEPRTSGHSKNYSHGPASVVAWRVCDCLCHRSVDSIYRRQSFAMAATRSR